jgi:hypothetical protein
MRAITTHHDGHGLAEKIDLRAGEPGPGGASHWYAADIADIYGADRAIYGSVLDVQYQLGPRNEPGSTPGVIDSVVLAIVRDRMEAFQAGPFACPENQVVLDHVVAAMDALKARADNRATRGALGTVKP